MTRRLIASAAAMLALALTAGSVSAAPFPATIQLPLGWAPEGVTAGHGVTAYVGSLADGAIARVNLRSGDVDVLAAGAAGRVTVGIDHEGDANRLWAAGGPTGEIRAYDARSGDLLGTWSVTAGFLNDVVVTSSAVYVTDSFIQQLIVIPLPADGSLPDPDAAVALPLTGDLVYGAGFNVNGIERVGRWLAVVQSSTGGLFRVDPKTGVTAAIDLGGAELTFGDGLESRGSTLFVVRNQANEIAIVKLRANGLRGQVLDALTSPDLDVPTTVALVGGRLWAVNARFGVPVTPTTEYWITRLVP
jgi:hypothetical protein